MPKPNKRQSKVIVTIAVLYTVFQRCLEPDGKNKKTSTGARGEAGCGGHRVFASHRLTSRPASNSRFVSGIPYSHTSRCMYSISLGLFAVPGSKSKATVFWRLSASIFSVSPFNS